MPISDYLRILRSKIGSDLVMLTAVSISVFDDQHRLLLGRDAETGFWTLPGGAIDPHEQPADAAVRECFEETGVLVRLTGLIGVFGGPEFLVRYPNGDLAYYIAIAFRAAAIGGTCTPRDGEMSALDFVGAADCGSMALTPSSRIIAAQAFAATEHPYFRPSQWTPPEGAV